MSQIKHRIIQFNNRLKQQYGFLANPALTKYNNAKRVLQAMPAEIYFNQPVAKAIFTFTTAPLPPGTKSLLSLGLKFCIRHRKPTNNIKKSIERIEYDVRTKVWVKENVTEDNDRDFNPKLYLKNPMWDPPEANTEVEEALKAFAQRITALHNKHQQRTTVKNLSYLQNQAMNSLVDHPNIFVCPADKNMGIALWLRHTGTKKILREHLSNDEVYENITHQIQAKKAELKHRWREFIRTHGRFLPDEVTTFFERSEETYGFKRIAPFRATCKVHKEPVKFRPVVAKVGTILEAISKWLDVELLKISKAYLTWCIKDSDTFRVEVIEHVLSPNSGQATLDARSMYSNIDLDHAEVIMGRWIDLYNTEGKLPELAHKGTIIAGLKLVMKWNIMKFGDSYFQQLVGTAMGTSCAVQFANLYFGWHEKEVIFPAFRDALQRIPFYRRFIDDVYLIWDGPCDNDWQSLEHAFNNYGILKWDFPEKGSSRSVNFLDLTLTIKGNRITTKTYQKPQNPYLYLPPHSAHAPGIMKGVIYGQLRTYYRQNTEYSDFVKISRLFFKRLVSQGWDQAVLKNLFTTAFNKLNQQLENPPPPPANDQPDRVGRLFFHLTFHPNDMPRREIRQIFTETLEEVVREAADIEQFTVAYSKPTTIGSRIAKAAMFEVEGREVSKYLAGEVPDDI